MNTSLKGLLVFAGIAMIFGFAMVVEADHSWGTYHWARTTSTFELKLGDNVSGVWDSVLATASSDWSQSSVLNTVIVSGTSNPKNCKPVAGRIEVCNSKYGNNGWLGIAQIWITGGEHITQAVTKLNDTYFATAKYNTLAWRNLVTCQEVGHTFGLDHQDEVFDNANLGTCMDYTNDPTTNQHPNAHDYELLEEIYAHVDSISTANSTVVSNNNNNHEINTDNPSSWGRAVAQDAKGRDSVFERDFGRGNKAITHVFWAE